MQDSARLSPVTLYWRKLAGCQRLYGTRETVRRVVKELRRPPASVRFGAMPDVSFVHARIAVGAAPRTPEAIATLRSMSFTHVVDLRAERGASDLLASEKRLEVRWVPTYDDWLPKGPDFFGRLRAELNTVLHEQPDAQVFICCGAGEHRAPLGGVVALVTLGVPMDVAVKSVTGARAVAEILPPYSRSFSEFLKSTDG